MVMVNGDVKVLLLKIEEDALQTKLETMEKVMEDNSVLTTDSHATMFNDSVSTEVSVVTHVEGQSAVQSRSKCKDKLPGVRSCQARQTEVPRVQKIQLLHRRHLHGETDAVSMNAIRIRFGAIKRRRYVRILILFYHFELIRSSSYPKYCM